MHLEYQKNFLDFLKSFDVNSFNPSTSGEWSMFNVLCDFLYELCNQKLLFEKDINFLKLKNNKEVVDYVLNSKGFAGALQHFVDKFADKYCFVNEKKESKISNAVNADLQQRNPSLTKEQQKENIEKSDAVENEANEDKQNVILNEVYAKRVLRKTNEEYVSMSDSLRLCFSENKGRYVETRNDVNPGEVLIVEKPFVAWLKPSLRRSYCNHCLKPLVTKNIKCEQCENAVFCSKECYEECFSKYHKIECNLSKAVEVLSKGHLALRIAFIVGSDEISRVTELAEGGKPKGTDYELVYSLVDHLHECSYTNLMFDILGAFFLSLLLKKLGLCNENTQLIVARALLKHLLQINMNSIQIMDQRITDLVKLASGEVTYKIKFGEDSIGIGLYQCLSLVNHSCYNVTKSLFNGSELCLVSNSQLQKGDEVTYNYGPHFKVANKEERQRFLSDLYYFDCLCKACEENWC